LFLGNTLVRQVNLAPYRWGGAGQGDLALNNLSAGGYVLRVVATDNGGQTSETSIRIQVNPLNQGPSISFNSPRNNQIFTQGNNVIVRAAASDSDGAVDNVSLFLNGTLIRQDNLAPYEWGVPGQNDTALSNLATGAHVLRIVVTDNDGATNERSINIRVNSANLPPTVSFTTPRNNQTFRPGDNVTVEVTTAGGNSLVDSVSLFVNNTLVRRQNSAPYRWGALGQNDTLLNNLAVGAHQLRVVATSANGSTAETTINIRVDNSAQIPSSSSPSSISIVINTLLLLDDVEE